MTWTKKQIKQKCQEPKRVWTKKQIERYCKWILNRKDVNVFYIPCKRLKALAVAVDYTMTIVYGLRMFKRATLWHECGHLSKNTEGKSVLVEFKQEWVNDRSIKGDDKDISDALGRMGRAERERYINEEVRAQIWAIKRAISMGHKNIAREIYWLLHSYGGYYFLAHKRMVKRLKKEGIEF